MQSDLLHHASQLQYVSIHGQTSVKQQYNTAYSIQKTVYSIQKDTGKTTFTTYLTFKHESVNFLANVLLCQIVLISHTKQSVQKTEPCLLPFLGLWIQADHYHKFTIYEPSFPPTLFMRKIPCQFKIKKKNSYINKILSSFSDDSVCEMVHLFDQLDFFKTITNEKIQNGIP